MVGMIPTITHAEAAEPTVQAPATEIKFYNEDGTKVVKTLKNNKEYKIGDDVVAEYKDGVLTLRNYTGGPISARNGSLTLDIYGTNTINANCNMHAISIVNTQDDDETPHLLSVTGKGTSPSITFNLNNNKNNIIKSGANWADEMNQKCFHAWIYTKLTSEIKDLTIIANRTDDYGETMSFGSLGISGTLENCKLTLDDCTIFTSTIENCNITSSKEVDAYTISNSTLNVTNDVGATIVKNSKIDATTLSASVNSGFPTWMNSITNSQDWRTLVYGSSVGVTIDNSEVNLDGSSTSSWSITTSKDRPAIEDFYFDKPTPYAFNAINEPGIKIINGSNVTIKNHNYGIISPMRGVLIENSNVTVDALSVAIGDLGTPAYGYGVGKSLYGLKVLGNSQVKLSAKEPTTYVSPYIASRLGTMALGYVREQSIPANTFDLTTGGFVELRTDAFDLRVPASEFPATLGAKTNVVDGAYDDGYIIATKTPAGYPAYSQLTHDNEDVYSYTVRIEGIKPTLTGEVNYTGGAFFNQQLRATVSGVPSGASIKYQWQIKNGDAWDDLSGETNAYVNIWGDTWAGRVGKQIRVVASADNYEGSLIGAEKTIGKNIPTSMPAAPALTSSLTADDKANVIITNYDSALEYVYTTSPSSEAWPTSGNAISGNSFPVDLETNPRVIYVYARYKATSSSEAGSRVASSSILLPGKGDSGEYARDLIYPAYTESVPTIYLRKNGSIDVDYQITPNTATNGLPQWKNTYTALDGTSASLSVLNDAENKKLSISAGNETGTVYVYAYKDTSTPYSEYWYYGSDHSNDGRRIVVKIYDPNDLSSIPFIDTYLGTLDLYEGESFSITKNDLRALSFVPEGENKDVYSFAARIVTYGAAGSITMSESNEYISLNNLDDEIRINANAKTTSSISVRIYALLDSTSPITTSSNLPIATYSVNVHEKPALALESLKVNPNSLTLRVGENFNLTAIKQPTGATGDVTWNSNNSSIATVSPTGQVTAISKGTTTITASLNGKSASTTVEVLPEICATHTKVYTYSTVNTHLWECSVCGEHGSENHTGSWTAVSGTDTHSITCTLCDIPADKKTEDHTWLQQGDPTPSQIGIQGETNYKCTKCNHTKIEYTPALTAINSLALTVTEPAMGGNATTATTSATHSTVSLTEWAEGSNDVYVGDAFEANKAYTVTVTVASKDNNVFTDATTFTINGHAATVVAKDATSATLTYTFDPFNDPYAITAVNFTLSGYEFDKNIVDITVTPDATTNSKLDYNNTYFQSYIICASDGALTGDWSSLFNPTSTAKFEAGKHYYLVIALDAKTGYNLTGLTKENAKLGTKSADVLLYSSTSTCIVFKLDKLIDSSHVHIPSSTWSKDATHHWKKCISAECGNDIESTKALHDFKWVVDKAATTTEKGSKHEECEECGYQKEAVEIPLLPTTNNNPLSPITGDNSNLLLWATLLVITGLGATVTIVSKKKRMTR